MRGIKDILDEIATEAADAGLEAGLRKRQGERPRSACCNADVEIPPLPWFPLCVRCNGLLNRVFQPFPGRHRRGHNERCLWGRQTRSGMSLGRGQTIAVIYRRPVYDEPDYLGLARGIVMLAGREAGMPIGKTSKYEIEFEPHCYIHFIDETNQDQQSRGRRFDAVYVIPPAQFIGDGIRRALNPEGTIHSVELEDAES